MSIFRLTLSFISFLTALALTSACAKKQAVQSEGTQSTGGGSATYSTAAEVDRAIDLAIRMAQEPNHRLNIFAQFFMDVGRVSSSDFIRSPEHLFPSLGTPDPKADLSQKTFGPNFKSPFLEALSKNKLTRRPLGDCFTTVTGEHKDASVSELSLNAEICISVGNLTRIPPSSLLREILSLSLHEAVHMAGAKEDEAKIWQTQFSEYFGRRFGDVSTDSVTAETFKAIGAAKVLVKRAVDAAEINGKDPKIFGWIGRAAQIMYTLPDILDPIALNLKMKTSKPDIYGNYANSVFLFLNEANIRFELPPLIPLNFPKPSTAYTSTFSLPFLGAATPEQVKATVGLLSKFLDQINENFLAFSGAEDAQSTCVKVGGVLNSQNFNRSVHKPIFPDVECSP